MPKPAPFTNSRSDYACDARPIGRGGYAEVFAAIHKPTGERVALKRLKPNAIWVRQDAEPRMRREINVMSTLAGHPHVMPILAADPRNRWYVMPLAEGDLKAISPELSDAELVGAFRDIASALEAAHSRRLVHRDVTPNNILRLEQPTRWVLADWGLVRRPLGQTTLRLTNSDHVVGTDGFIAPELFVSGHRAPSSASDVFSLGRVIAWAASGRVPLAGERLVPPGPFRQVVRETTHVSPSERCSLLRLRQLLDEVVREAPADPADIAHGLARRARDGDLEAILRLADHVDAHALDSGLFVECVPAINGGGLDRLVSRDPEALGRLCETMGSHLLHGDLGRNYGRATVALSWLLSVCVAADDAADLALLQDAGEVLFEAAAEWQQYAERDKTRKWLNRLRGAGALAIARALRAQPRAAEWYVAEGWRPGSGMDRAVRHSLYDG